MPAICETGDIKQDWRNSFPQQMQYITASDSVRTILPEIRQAWCSEEPLMPRPASEISGYTTTATSLWLTCVIQELGVALGVATGVVNNVVLVEIWPGAVWWFRLVVWDSHTSAPASEFEQIISTLLLILSSSTLGIGLFWSGLGAK